MKSLSANLLYIFHLCMLILQAFLKRNPEVSVRTPERVSKARGGITEEIRNWFENARTQFARIPGANDALADPRRVFNTDESCIQLAPPTGKVISITGWKNVYEVAPAAEKSNLTFLGTYNANGETVTPMIVYPYIRLPAEISSNIPRDFHVAQTESGWMTSKLFYEFIANPFTNWLNEHKIQRPVILFVDGHKTHITLQTSVLCQDNGIILYLLPPNTTHILQPADVGPFRPMKHYWREEVIEFQRRNPGQMITRKDVAPLLSRVIKKVAEKCIKNGFRKSGIYPFDVEAVDFTRCLDIMAESEDDNQPSEPQIKKTLNFKEAYACIEEILGARNLQKSLKNELDSGTLNEMVRTIASRANVVLPSVQNEDIPSNLESVEVFIPQDGSSSVSEVTINAAESTNQEPGPSYKETVSCKLSHLVSPIQIPQNISMTEDIRPQLANIFPCSHHDEALATHLSSEVPSKSTNLAVADTLDD